ncbi:hypothetical protein CYY_005239 [Polysphondylium violaceum]|uniref:DDHD domain-containing protein n=1 Tax=Polysphondylium violaceum TaxID=133409 RepID=A0A8J4V714_9MYCE|nr:hypothetical protein CYY_005239 [Polysphondylium violaceum]
MTEQNTISMSSNGIIENMISYQQQQQQQQQESSTPTTNIDTNSNSSNAVDIDSLSISSIKRKIDAIDIDNISQITDNDDVGDKVKVELIDTNTNNTATTPPTPTHSNNKQRKDKEETIVIDDENTFELKEINHQNNSNGEGNNNNNNSNNNIDDKISIDLENDNDLDALEQTLDSFLNEQQSNNDINDPLTSLSNEEISKLSNLSPPLVSPLTALINNSNGFSSGAEQLDHNTPPPNPYEIDPVLKKKYVEEEMAQEKLKQQEKIEKEKQSVVDHIVFIVHGMGAQLGDSRVITLEQNVNLLKKNFNQFQKEDQQIKVDFQIIEWHSKLRNTADLNENIEKISPSGAKKVRDFVNETLLDVLLYMSPLYNQEILKEVSCQINNVYETYLNTHQNFKGHVSIFAHSLGSVIIWDILSKGLIKFKVENVFGMGSPVGIFLTLKGINIGQLDIKSELPNCKNWYNIFSKTDPVAYRIEPFIDSNYLNYEPCNIEVQPEKKGFQKFTGFFSFKSNTATTSSTKLTNTNSSSTTTTTTTEMLSSSPSTTTTTTNNTNPNNTNPSTTTTNTTSNDVEMVDKTNQELVENVNIKKFKIHPLEPDSPSTSNSPIIINGSNSNNNNSNGGIVTDSIINNSPSSTTSYLSGSLSGSLKSKFFMSFMSSNSTSVSKSPTQQQPLPTTTITTPPPSTTSTGPTIQKEPISKQSLPLNAPPQSSLLSEAVASSNSSSSASTTIPSSSPPKNIQENIMLSKELMVDFEKGEKRYDYCMEEQSSLWMNAMPAYVGSIFSHLCYWDSGVVALFIMKKLAFSSKSTNNSSNNNNNTTATTTANGANKDKDYIYSKRNMKEIGDLNLGVDLDEIDKLLEGRVTNINDVYKSQEFKQMIDAWKSQKNQLRASLIEFWNDYQEKTEFVSWWNKLNNQYKTALLLTSIEELKQDLDNYEEYSGIACPELLDTDTLLKSVDSEYDYSAQPNVPAISTVLFRMINQAVDSKENDSSNFTGLNRMKLHYSDLEDPQFVVQSMLVVRSCILLGFFVNIVLLYRSQDE